MELPDKTPTTAVVASTSIDAVTSEGETFLIELEVATPYLCETGEWACPVALRGLYDGLRDARGENSFQALCMAISLAQELLQGFCEQGGRLLMGKEDFPLEAYAFGAAIRRRRPKRSNRPSATRSSQDG